MYKQIIIPNSDHFLINLPAEFIGKKVEVIAYPVESTDKKKEAGKSNKRLKKLVQMIENNPLILPDDFYFDRNELYE